MGEPLIGGTAAPYMRMFRCTELDQRIKDRLETSRFYREAGMPVVAASVRRHACDYEAEIQRRLREITRVDP